MASAHLSVPISLGAQQRQQHQRRRWWIGSGQVFAVHTINKASQGAGVLGPRSSLFSSREVCPKGWSA